MWTRGFSKASEDRCTSIAEITLQGRWIMTKPIDRFIDGALNDFSKWLVTSTWRGKERDCVNLFAMRFLIPRTGSTAAISDPALIRIEGTVPQPRGYKCLYAPKDLVVWQNPLDVAWDDQWRPVKDPWVVMGWKTRRSGPHAGDCCPI